VKQPVKMIKTDSSTVSAVGYDAGTNTLFVQYAKTGMYRYHGVSPETYARLLKSPSKGGFISKEIKPSYRHTKG
jgi:hypothetical protein